MEQANQTLVPSIAQLHERDRAAIPKIYRESYRLVFFLAVPSMSLAVLASPLISRLWLGKQEAVLIQFVGLLAAGWLVNILSNPAYVVDLGTGSLRWVSMGVTATAILNVALGTIAGLVAGPVAIVAAGAFALAAGYAMILLAYHREHRESFSMLIPDESRKILALSALGACISILVFFRRSAISSHLANGLSVLATVFAGAMIALIWRHPIRVRLFHWLAKGMAA